MQERLNEIFEKHRPAYSGTILVKQADSTLLSAAAGLAHRGFNVTSTIDTRFDTASVTKVFTATAVLQLVQHGLLRLDDKIADIIDLRGTAISELVTLEHLMTHTSGIADDADEESGEDYSALFVEKPNYSLRDCVDFLPQFVNKPPNFAPGTDVRYNNCAFILLGLAIERITQTPYREYITHNVFDACGMTHSQFCAMDEVNANVAEGYILKPGTDSTSKWCKSIYSYPPVGTADSGAYTTVGDLDIFLRAVLQGRLLNPRHSALLFRPHCEHSREHRHGKWRTGYAFEFVEDGNGEPLCMFKEGLNAGVEAMCAYFPRADITVNLLANTHGTLFPLFRELQALLLKNE